MFLVVAFVLLGLALDGVGKVEDVGAVVQSWGIAVAKPLWIPAFAGMTVHRQLP